MITTINNEHKELNFSSEREQSQACLNSAEHEKNQGRKVLNVPNLRFPEFQGEWEKCKVSDLLDFYSTNSLSWDKLEYGTDAIQNLHYGLIHVGLPTIIDLSKDKLPNITNGNTPKNYELCQEGDIAFADASEDTNEVAKAVEFYKLNGKDVICGLHTIHGRDNQQKTVIGYKGYAFSSTAFHHQIRRIAQGTKIYSINSKNFSECYIGIPSKEEQKKIATLLRLIDERIVTQNKIIDKLQSLIKGIVDSTISCKPKNSTIGYVCSVSEQIKAAPNLDDIITVRLHGKGVCKSSVENLQLGATQYYHRKAGQLIYGKQNFHNGAIGIVPENLNNAITSKDIPSFDIKSSKCNPLYLLIQLQSPHYYKPAESLTTGTGSKRLKEETFLKMPIFLPDKERQDSIATLISSIMMKLNKADKTLNLLIKQKQYLLRQMFI